MEQKTLRYVVITVGTVGVLMILTVVLGLVFFAPRNGDPWRIAAGGAKKNTVHESRSPASNDAGEWTRFDSDTREILPLQEGKDGQTDSTAAAGSNSATAPDANGNSPAAEGGTERASNTATSTSGNVIFIYGEAPKDASTAELVTLEDGSTVIDLTGAPRPERPAIKPTEEAVTVEPAASPAVAKTPVAAATKPAAAKPVAAKPAAVKPAAKSAPVPTKLVEQFFIQAGAYSTKARADAIKAQLAEKKIKALVQIREVNGKTLFRVRVGPYNTKSEAEYWLSLIKTFEGFGESYVSMTKVRR